MTQVVSPAAGELPATHVRYRVVALAIVLGMITYLDRVCISTLAPQIMDDLSLSQMQMSYVFSAFALSYAAFGVPSAAWADRVGTRNALSAIVVWWSCFTMVTAAGLNLASLMVIRFLFGAGEAGAWPAVTRTFSKWIPYRERGSVQGIFFIGAHIAGGMTPLIVMWLAGFLHWRTIFLLFGLLGFVWAAVWYFWFRDHPAIHSQVNAAELAMIVEGRDQQPHVEQHAGWQFWRRLLVQRNMIALCLMYTPNSFAFFFCITWLPRFLEEKHGLTEASLGIFTGLPLILSVVADGFGGVTSDWAVRRCGPRWGRAGVGFAAYLFAGIAMFLATLTANPWIAASALAAGTAASMFMLGAAWGTCQDIGGEHAGVVSATMNTAGQFGSLTCPILVTYLVEWFHDWNAALALIGVMFLFGALCWCFIDPRRRLFA